MPTRSLLDSQIRYYDARADGYEESLAFRSGRFSKSNPDAEPLAALQRTLRILPAVQSTLEIACGTGIWTRELLRTSRTVHALDASARMIELNRRKIGATDRVTYERADIFTWNAARRFHRIAAAFWISHVPDDLLEVFVDKIECANTPDGEIVLIDEEHGDESAGQATRELPDGRRFSIVKVFRTTEQIEHVFERARYRTYMSIAVGRFFVLVLRRDAGQVTTA